MLQLYVIRHAIAVPRNEGLDDAARPLTPKGRHRWRQAVAGLGRLGFNFDRLYHSPWLRAVETAEALVRLVEGETVVTQNLARPPSQELLDEIKGERVALVGHQPWLGELLGLLVAGRRELGDSLELKKGAVVCLEGELREAGMTLVAALPPSVLRALGS
ncbi:MAG: SixA phosphatase family protein [Myxococcaceae bacterium]